MPGPATVGPGAPGPRRRRRAMIAAEHDWPTTTPAGDREDVRRVPDPHQERPHGRRSDRRRATGRPSRDAPYAVELRGITKRFPGVVANRDIELRVARGEVHAIVGENGAGKSTLMKTLYGDAPPRRGRRSCSTAARCTSAARPTPSPPASAWSTSTSCWPTTSPSSRTSSWAASPPRAAGWTAPRPAAGSSRSPTATRLGLRPDELVEDLGVGDRQRVEIAKVLYRGARILILDEPTAVLVPQEVDELFGNLAELKREGLTVIFISHKLDEVRKVADSITVIRRGTTVGDGRPADDDRAPAGRDDGRRRAALAGDPRRRRSARRRCCGSSDVTVPAPDGRAAGRRRRPHRPRGRGRRHRRRRGQRPGRAGRRDHGPAAARRPAPCCSGSDDITALVHPRPPRGRHRLHPGGPAPAGHAARRAALGEPDPRPPDPPAGGEGRLHRPQGGPRRHRADHARVRRPRARARHPRPSRCPAATSRS